MKVNSIRAICIAISCLFLSTTAAADAARLLMQQDRPLPGTPPTPVPTAMSSTSIHSNGQGFAVKAGLPTEDFFWGAPGEITPDGAFFGLVSVATDGAATGSLPMVALAPDGRTLFSTAAVPYRLWEIPPASPQAVATILAEAGTQLPAPLANALGADVTDFYGNFLSTFSYSDGLPVWRATWNDVPPAGGTTFPPNWSLIKGYPDGTGADAPLVLVRPGQEFPDVPNPVASTTSIRAYGFTSVGVARDSDNHIVEIYMTRTDGVTSNDDSVMVLNGAGLVLGGELVRERSLIPESIGGLPNEDYRAFKAAHISATGDYGFRVQAFRPGPTFNELLFINGQLALREGDTLSYQGDDFILGGGNLDYELVFNSQGDWATNWNTSTGSDVVIVNGEIVAASLITPVDSDGDGIGDTLFGTMALVIDRLAITDRRPDGTVEVLFQAFGTGDQAARQGIYAISTQVATVWTVSASVTAGEGTIDPPQQVVEDGGTAEFTLTPEAGWSVVSVDGDTCLPTDNGDGTWTAAGIVADCAVDAVFAINEYTVEAAVISGEGEISPAIQHVAHGAEAEFVVVPATGWSVVSVDGDTCLPTDNGDGTWTAAGIVADCAVDAVFAINEYTVEAVVISGEGEISPATQHVAHGAEAEFVVIPATGWSVVSVDGDTCLPTDNGDGTWTAAGIVADCIVAAQFAETTDDIFEDRFEP